jgi:hypothetical protein
LKNKTYRSTAVFYLFELLMAAFYSFKRSSVLYEQVLRDSKTPFFLSNAPHFNGSRPLKYHFI